MAIELRWPSSITVWSCAFRRRETMALSCVLVDDEPLALERMSALLSEAAPDVMIAGRAAGGEDAVALIATLRPDVVFLDVQMPVLDGFDVVDLIAVPRPHIVF